ncbi:MAG TPA: hypothetical protein VM327_11015 [Candidatus Thermoplasmatota archaeon]|nr:hypothetical protein [Candidatus Thermoplasmatota archaeon]
MADSQPQCGALTANGKQCRNSARGTSKYCASHKGYQPPALKGLAKRIEGDSWSATDKRTDRQSKAIADTRPAARKAADTQLAVRGKGKRKTAARKLPAAKAAPPPRSAPRRVTGKKDAGYVATILQPQRDYLVIYEEPDPDGLAHDDSLLLDIDAGQPVSLGEVDLEQKLDLELSNNTNAMGTVGFILACLGALVAVVACIMFAVAYPDPWYTSSGQLSSTNLIPGTLIVGVLGALTMLAGVMLTHYGRRIQARGNLSRMRIVEKSFQPRVALGEET